MIQDIAPHTFENHYHPEARIRPDDPVLIFQGERILCRILSEEQQDIDPASFREDEQVHDGTGNRVAEKHPTVMEYPTWNETKEWTLQNAGIVPDESELTYLFTIDGTNFFYLENILGSGGQNKSGKKRETEGPEKVEEDPRKSADNFRSEPPAGLKKVLEGSAPEALPGFGFYTLNELRERNVGPKVREFAAMTGVHLAHWYRNNRFCGRCGSRTEKDSVERALFCPNCGNKIYPRIVPAVIVGILNPEKNQILLTKYRVGYSHYALVAGFTEIGETLEGTVRREVMEETGLKVKNIRYYKSQPWGIVDDLLAGFYCEVDGDDTIRMDRGELKVAEWVSPEDVELQPEDFSLTNEMMYLFKTGKVYNRQ